MEDRNSSETKETTAQSKRQWIIENVVSLGLALLIVFMIRSSVVEAFKIPSGSMIPTLYIGDHIFVNKFAYGFKIPFSDLVTGKPIYIIEREPPKRGDIIVFVFPKDESFFYIKRVIGVPGDKVEYRDKTLYINGKEVSKTPLPEKETQDLFLNLADPKYASSHMNLYAEKLDEHDEGHHIFTDEDSTLSESFGPITVPKDRLFVMGDNRDYSNDSRFWGFVPFTHVKGRAMVIWLSFEIDLGAGHFSFRPDRIGSVLH